MGGNREGDGSAGCGLWYPKNEQQWPRRVRNSNRQCPMITQGEISDEEDI